MNTMTEEHQRKEIEMRERVRRISLIADRITADGVWKTAEEIEILQRKIYELECDLLEQAGNGK